MLHRVLQRGQLGAEEWENEHTQSYDWAKKGPSALTAALLTNVRAEIAFWRNFYIVRRF